MTSTPDARPPLDRARLDPARLPAALAGRVEIEDETGSTNAVLASRAREGATGGSVLVTEHQVAGRGRLDRVWTTPARSALTFSFLLRPDLAPARWPWIPLATGYAVHQALVGRLASVGLKWPNDVLVTGPSTPDRKLAGILVERIETPQGPAAVIGIGLNVSLTEEERPVPTATSLLIELGEELDRTALLADLVESLDGATELLSDAAALRAAYSSACVTIGRDVRVELPSGESLVGRASGLDESGRLGVDTPQGTTWVGAGDVIHVR